MPFSTYRKILAILPALSAAAFSQSSLASRVLIVYSSSDQNSMAVAEHYQAARGVPNANLCPIAAPTAQTIPYSDYVTLIKTPLQSCLHSVGPQNILYIVLAYLRPAAIEAPSTQTYAVDSYLSDIWDQYATRFFSPVPTAVHRYYAESQSQGNAFIPFQSLAAYRATSRAQLIYSVWRLDATGLAQVNFNVTTKAVAANTTVNITSSYAGASNTVALTITP